MACLPQAWAAGSVFMMLQACLGISVDGVRGQVDLFDPHLPIGIGAFSIDGLRVGDERVNLRFDQASGRVKVRVDGHGVKVNVSA